MDEPREGVEIECRLPGCVHGGPLLLVKDYYFGECWLCVVHHEQRHVERAVYRSPPAIVNLAARARLSCTRCASGEPAIPSQVQEPGEPPTGQWVFYHYEELYLREDSGLERGPVKSNFRRCPAGHLWAKLMKDHPCRSRGRHWPRYRHLCPECKEKFSASTVDRYFVRGVKKRYEEDTPFCSEKCAMKAAALAASERVVDQIEREKL